jgi:hypothetical protein
VVTKKEVNNVSWKESLKELGVEMLATLKTSLIVISVLVIIVLAVNYVPKILSLVF